MIRTIDIHTGHLHFDTDVMVIAKNECAVLRIIVGGAEVNISVALIGSLRSGSMRRLRKAA